MSCVTPYYQKIQDRIVPVGCGRCPYCKSVRSKQWAFRLSQEEKRSTSCHFITLTWDTEYIPINKHGQFTLRKSIVTKRKVKKIINGKEIDVEKVYRKPHPESVSAFIKRLRRYQKVSGNDQTIKYYAVGEYGEQFGRPHYHIMIFNLEGSKKVGKVNGYDAYKNKDVEKAWSIKGQQRGRIHIGDGTGNSSAYCAKYIDKNCDIGKAPNDIRVPSYSVMSKGLGSNYIVDRTIKRKSNLTGKVYKKDVLKNAISNYHKDDLTRTMVSTGNGHKVAIPRYYKEKLFTEEEKEEIQVLTQGSIKQHIRDERQRIRNLYKKRIHPDDYNYENRTAIFEAHEKKLNSKPRKSL
jgi:hypothetical protein